MTSPGGPPIPRPIIPLVVLHIVLSQILFSAREFQNCVREDSSAEEDRAPAATRARRCAFGSFLSSVGRRANVQVVHGPGTTSLFRCSEDCVIYCRGSAVRIAVHCTRVARNGFTLSACDCAGTECILVTMSARGYAPCMSLVTLARTVF